MRKAIMITVGMLGGLWVFPYIVVFLYVLVMRLVHAGGAM